MSVVAGTKGELLKISIKNFYDRIWIDTITQSKIKERIIKKVNFINIIKRNN